MEHEGEMGYVPTLTICANAAVKVEFAEDLQNR